MLIIGLAPFVAHIIRDPESAPKIVFGLVLFIAVFFLWKKGRAKMRERVTMGQIDRGYYVLGGAVSSPVSIAVAFVIPYFIVLPIVLFGFFLSGDGNLFLTGAGFDIGVTYPGWILLIAIWILISTFSGWLIYHMRKFTYKRKMQPLPRFGVSGVIVTCVLSLLIVAGVYIFLEVFF